MMRTFKDRINEVEGAEFPSKTYRKMVLQPAYDEAKKYFLHSMIQIHAAHLKMLEEQGIVSGSDAVKIGKAIHALDIDYYSTDNYNPLFEDLFFRIEHDLIEKRGYCGEFAYCAKSQ